MKTEPATDEASELPSLTHQQQKFVEGIVSGKTASDAYRAAYDCENSTASTVWAAASRLRSDAKVSAWIAAAQKACLGSTVLTLDDHLRQLERLREIALDSGNIGAAVLAEHHRGKVKGHYVDQVRDVTDQYDPVRTLNEIAAEVGHEAAEKMARERGIPWTPPAVQSERVH